MVVGDVIVTVDVAVPTVTVFPALMLLLLKLGSVEAPEMLEYDAVIVWLPEMEKEYVVHEGTTPATIFTLQTGAVAETNES